MNKVTHTSLVLLAIIFSVLFGRASHGDAAAVTNPGVSADDLTLRLSSERNQYLKGEPMLLTFGLSNETQTAIAARGILGISQNVSLISNNGSQEFRWDGENHPLGLLKLPLVNMPPGSETGPKVLLLPEMSEKIFPNSGSYSLKIEFSYYLDPRSDIKTVLVSNSIGLRIDEPTGLNRMAYEYYQNSVKPVLDRYIEREALEARREFSRRFGENVYSKYNTFELGRLYAAMGNIQAAENEFYAISDVDFYLADQVDTYLGRLGRQLGQATPRTKRPRVQSNIPNPTGWIERPDIRPNYNIAPIPAPVLVPNPTATPRIQ